MIQIRPVSDLRNKYPEVEELVVRNNQPVFLTKNGYGSMVVMSLEQYSALTESIEMKLDDADNQAESDLQRFSHEEVFNSIREKYVINRTYEIYYTPRNIPARI